MKDTNHVMGHLKTAKTIYGDKENRERTEATPQYLICNYIFGKIVLVQGLVGLSALRILELQNQFLFANFLPWIRDKKNKTFAILKFILNPTFL